MIDDINFLVEYQNEFFNLSKVSISIYVTRDYNAGSITFKLTKIYILPI